MPTISHLTIAILTYRRPRQLNFCLKQLKSQTCQPKKYLIIDSFRLKKNIPQCRNLALKLCRTPYLAFIDDDCLPASNWLESARRAITRHPDSAYITGRTRLQNPENSLARLQFSYYQKYFQATHPLDTKNIILNCRVLKNFRFDIRFNIFEDVDFQRQLLIRNFHGVYDSHLLVRHPESTSLIVGLIKKFRQGLYKAKVNTKWGNFDNFQPSLPRTKNLIDFLLKSAFNLGYIFNRPQLITIVNHLDQGANQQRLLAFQKFYNSHGYTPTIIDSFSEFQKTIASRRYLVIFGWPWLRYRLLKNYCQKKYPHDFGKYILPATIILKARILNRLLRQNFTSLAIIQYPEDMLVAANRHRPFRVLYDSPTLFFQEINDPQIRIWEMQAYQNADFVSFHWHTYLKLLKSLNIFPKKPLKLNWGCSPSAISASVAPSPRIVYLGMLNSDWVNPQLLISLSALHPIDVYSYQAPDPRLYPPGSINYLGYLKDLADLGSYQFGLITITDSPLRRHGFSAKALEYLGYGLPILCPDWRHDRLLDPAVIPYNLKTFNRQIKKYSRPKNWNFKHRQALQLAGNLIWDKNLQPLLSFLDDSHSRIL